MARIDHQVTYCGTVAQHQQLSAALGRPSISRTLETTYFDTDELALYRAGAMLRNRRTVGSPKFTTEAKVPANDGLERSSGEQAWAAVSHLASRAELAEVATQTKARTLHFIGHPTLGNLAPDVVVALDEAAVETACGTANRLEIELQLFTKLPWNSKVDPSRLDRFRRLCETYEEAYGLERSASSGYQAIQPELLR